MRFRGVVGPENKFSVKLLREVNLSVLHRSLKIGYLFDIAFPFFDLTATFLNST